MWSIDARKKLFTVCNCPQYTHLESMILSNLLEVFFMFGIARDSRPFPCILARHLSFLHFCGNLFGTALWLSFVHAEMPSWRFLSGFFFVFFFLIQSYEENIQVTKKHSWVWISRFPRRQIVCPAPQLVQRLLEDTTASLQNTCPKRGFYGHERLPRILNPRRKRCKMSSIE